MPSEVELGIILFCVYGMCMLVIDEKIFTAIEGGDSYDKQSKWNEFVRHSRKAFK